MDLAPSVGNARPWRVVEVCDAKLRSLVRKNFEEANAQAAMSYKSDRQAEYLNLKLAGLDVAPVQLAIFTMNDPMEGHGLGRQTIAGTLHQSTAMAIHTLWLAARCENIGVGVVSILDPGAIERLFGVPCEWEFSAYLCLGYPEFKDDLPLLHRANWQENLSHRWVVR